MAIEVKATFEYSGLSDYWSGNGNRWRDDSACVFAFYAPGTTLGDMIDEWARDDSDMQGKRLWESEYVTDAMINDALLAMLTDAARATLDAEWANAHDLGVDCGHDYDSDDCDCDACTSDESPQAIALLELYCSDCGERADDCGADCGGIPQIIADLDARPVPCYECAERAATMTPRCAECPYASWTPPAAPVQVDALRSSMATDYQSLPVVRSARPCGRSLNMACDCDRCAADLEAN